MSMAGLVMSHGCSGRAPLPATARRISAGVLGFASSGMSPENLSLKRPDERSVGLGPKGAAGCAPLERYLKPYSNISS